MKKLIQPSLIQDHTKLHLSRCKTFSFLVNAIMTQKTCNLAKLAPSLNPEATTEANYKRIISFMREVEVDWRDLMSLNLYILGSRMKEVKLVIDRTGWERGEHAYNILFLSVLINDRSSPLLFIPLENEGGNSSMEDRIQLIEKALEFIPAKKIEVLLGDREFGNSNFINYLNQKSIAYCLRLKDDWHYFQGENDESPKLISDAAADLKPGQTLRL